MIFRDGPTKEVMSDNLKETPSNRAVKEIVVELSAHPEGCSSIPSYKIKLASDEKSVGLSGPLVRSTRAL